MSIEARNELAMILPLPARVPAGEADVNFIDLKDYPQFFSELEHGFPKRLHSNSHTLFRRVSGMEPCIARDFARRDRGRV